MTFADHVLIAKEATRRFNSLATHILNVRYAHWIRVIERHKNGRVHFHLLVVLDSDIRTGVDFPAFEEGVYRSASVNLRSEWAFWRNTAPAYGFGRTELLPVKSTSEGIARYVGKYISKHIGQRIDADKGVRLVAYSKGARRCNANFTWRTPGADLWRYKLQLFASALGGSDSNYREKFKEWFGPNWVFHLGQVIEEIKLPVYPTWRHFIADYPRFANDEVPKDSIDIRLEPSCQSQQSIAKAILTAEQVRNNFLARQRSEGKTPKPIPVHPVKPETCNVEKMRRTHLEALAR